MTVSPPGSGIITSIATQATLLKAAQLQTDLSLAILSEALDVQEALVSELLESSGVGQNVDVTV